MQTTEGRADSQTGIMGSFEVIAGLTLWFQKTNIMASWHIIGYAKGLKI